MMDLVCFPLGWAALGPLVLLHCGTSTDCASYLRASVTEMRKATGSGCFELEHVVVVARSPSANLPRVYVQDRGGGPYSAIRAKCDQSPTHACSAGTAQQVESLLDGAQVTLRGYYLQGSISGFEELYLDEAQDEGMLASPPPVPRLELAAMSRDARAKADWFQVVSAEVSPLEPLVMYDFSPPEFARSGPCPTWVGFAVIPAPASTPGVAAGCASGVNPSSVDVADPREILIGREFFKEFFASTDCACAATSKQHLLNASSSVAGSIEGVLTPEMRPGTSRVYQVFHPLSKAAFPIVGG